MTEPGAEALSREERRPIWWVAGAVLAAGAASWMPVAAGVWHDDGVYMLIGRALANGHGLTYEGVVGAPPAVKFPPLYPGVLAVLWAVLGDVGRVTFAAVWLNLVVLALSAAAFALALTRVSGISLRTASMISGCAFISADIVRFGLVTLSESVFLGLSMAAFAMWPAAARDDGRRARFALAAVLLLAVATRSAGIALVPAFAVGLGVRRGARVAFATVAPAVAFVGLWTWWSAARAAEIPEGLRDILGPYGSWLASQTGSAGGEVLAELPRHAGGVLVRVASMLAPGWAGPWLVAALVPLAALAAIGTSKLVREAPPLGWYLLAYLGLLFLWPFQDDRLVVPIHPIVLAAVVLGAQRVRERLPGGRPRRAWTAAASVAAALYVGVTAVRIAERWPAAPFAVRAGQLAGAVEMLATVAPGDAVVGAPELWPALHLHGGWTVAPSALFRPRAPEGVPLWGRPEDQVDLWRTAGIDYLVLEEAGVVSSAALDRLEAECPGTVFIPARTGALLLIELQWQPGCTSTP